MDLLLLLLALLLGAALGFLVARVTGATAQAQPDVDPRALTSAREEASAARGEAVRAREELAAVRADATRQSLEAAELRTTVADAQRLVAEARGETARVAAQVAAAAAQRDAAVQKAVEQAADREALLNQFKVLSAESLERQNRQADAATEQRLKATEQLVAPLTDGLRQNVRDRGAELVARRDLRWAAAAAELSRSLLAPFEDLLRGRRSVVVVPDGALWGVPFQALPLATGEPLVERLAVSYAPSPVSYTHLTLPTKRIV